MASHSSILSWRIPRTEEPGRLPSKGVSLFHSFLLWGLFLLSNNFGFGLFFFFFSVSQGVKIGYICGLSFFLMLGIYHHILLSQNGFCCIPYVLVCCVSIFVSLRYFYDWKGYDFSLLALAKACFVSQSVIPLRERSVLTGEECVSCRCWAQCSVYIRSPFGLRYSPLCSYWLSA